MELVMWPVWAAVAFGLIRLVVWARKNPDPLHEMEDPETDASERDWMDAIR